MRLDALTKAGEIREALDQLTSCLMAGSVLFDDCVVAYKGGRATVPVYWRPDEQFWFHSTAQQTHYHCWYGVQDPGTYATLSLTCEVNPPIQGTSSTCRGAFARDHSGVVYYLHTGWFSDSDVSRIAQKYFNTHGGPWADVWWPNKRHRDLVLIGALDDVALIENIAQFVWLVERFKEDAKKAQVR